jgi:ribosome-associated protein
LVYYPKRGDETLDRSDSTQKAVQAARTAIDKKAIDTIVLDLKDRSTITDYFVICSGENTAQIRAISEAIEKKFTEFSISPLGIEGLDFCRWVLMDYDDVIVHIFSKEARAYYEIERLWKDAQRIEL